MSTAIEKHTDRDVASTGVERTRNRPQFQPRVDILELADELVLVADMPGVEAGGIDIQFEKGVLSIHGKVEVRQSEGTHFLSAEYGLGDYHRTFQVSEVIDASGIEAEYAGGELTLHLPKVKAAKPRKIEVKSK